MKKEFKKRRLVFTLSKNDDVGVVIEAYVVSLNELDEFSLSFRKVNMNTVYDYDIVLNDCEIQLIEIINNYSEDVLVKKFSKNNQKAKDFFKHLKPEHFHKVIRPYVEKRLIEGIEIIKKHDVPIYFKGRKKDAISEKPIKVVKEPADVVFNFIRENSKTKYFLNIKHLEKEISLTGKKYTFITHKPCWLLLGNTLFSFNEQIDSKKLIPFFTKKFVEIPPQSEKKYFETFILNAIRNYNVNAKGFDVETPETKRTAVFNLNNDFSESPLIQLSYHYDDVEFLSNDTNGNKVFLKKGHDDYKFVKINRNINWEQEIIEFIQNLGFKHKQGALYVLSDKQQKTVENGELKYQIITWLSEHKEMLDDKKIKIVQNPENTFVIGRPEINFRVTKEKDWFDVYGNVQFKGYEIPFINLRDHILNGNREFVLPDGKIALIPEEWFSKYEDLLKFGKNTRKSVKLDKHHFTLIRSLNDKFISNKLKKYNDFNIKKIHYKQVPKGINAQLRPYQLQGFNWMNYLYENNLSGCLADDMGLGKTLQVIALLMKFKEEFTKEIAPGQDIGKTKPVEKQLMLFDTVAIGDEAPASFKTSLIVMPLSLIHNWEDEIRKFAPGLRYFKYMGYKREQNFNKFADYDVILTTYGVIRNDINMLITFPFFYVILDESQMIKNPGSKVYRSVKKINSEYRLALTGTPVENSLIDLWSQMSFLNNGLLGNIHFFKQYFVSPIEKNQDETQKERLHRLIEPFILRRTKDSVAKDLPDLSIKTYYCEMSERQRALYEKEKSSIRNLILQNIEKKGKDKASFIILNGLMKLRLLANHPKLINNENADESGKFDEVIRSIHKLISENHKVLIYSSFVKHLNLFKAYFEENNIRYEYLIGNANENQRKKKIKEFQKHDDIKVFLISIKAGGTGLNLTSADYVFIIDPWWNPAVESQAINRTHRIGQNRNVLAYKFIVKDSIEEKILNLQEYKKGLTDEMMHNKNPFKDFTEEDINHLLS